MTPLVALVALVAAMAAILIAYSASPAHAAAESCTTTAGTTTCTYSPTGAEDTFEVPLGVSTIHVEATGAPGAVGSASGNARGPAGRGARVSGDLTVTPGDALYVEVGGAPTGGGTSACYVECNCIGGFNGGGSSGFYAGGGGGASDVRTAARGQDGSLATRLIVAGGGGGSGSSETCLVSGGSLAAGAGGDAGSAGGDGPTCGTTPGGTGGKAGGQSGGAGGSPDGQSGSLGQGGNAGSTGGGGGGGYYGGGGSGGSTFDSDSFSSVPAGGGGGGSNLVPTDGTADIADSGPSVIISYTAPVGYDFQGFFRPVDNPDVATNKAKAGSAIPVKFSLSGDQGLDIFATGTNPTTNETFTYPTSTAMACDSTDELDAVEETVSAGGSSLQYDAALDQYTYVWKTNKAWAGTCRQLVVKLDDGTYHRANFQFVK
jgi:hypothetical protein